VIEVWAAASKSHANRCPPSIPVHPTLNQGQLDPAFSLENAFFADL
jgi:hypothetical protein